MESVYNYEKQDTTWNRKLKSMQQNPKKKSESLEFHHQSE